MKKRNRKKEIIKNKVINGLLIFNVLLLVLSIASLDSATLIPVATSLSSFGYIFFYMVANTQVTEPISNKNEQIFKKAS